MAKHYQLFSAIYLFNSPDVQELTQIKNHKNNICSTNEWTKTKQGGDREKEQTKWSREQWLPWCPHLTQISMGRLSAPIPL